VNDPTQPDQPQQRRQHEVNRGNQQSTLHELPQAGDEEAAYRREYVAGGSVL